MPFFQPMPLGRKAQPFDRPEWIYELKYDGFRALAVVEYGRCALFSRSGHPFASFSELASRIGYAVMPRSVVMDGEIICLDQKGLCQFPLTCYSGVATRASLHSIFSRSMGGTCVASA
jgi:bifunctional non-homologous end joining protein LigD